MPTNAPSNPPPEPRQQSGARVLLTGILILTAGYAGICLLAFALQRSVLFPRGGEVWRDPSSAGWRFDDVWLEHDLGRTHAWYIHTPEAKGTVIFSHGNAETIANRLESIEDFVWLGFDVLIYDYGGYGKSDGAPSEQRCFADIRAAWDFVTQERGVAPERVVLFGRSLGTGPTSWLATQVQPAAVIVESPFLSVWKMAQETVPFLPMRLLTRDKFDNARRVGEITAPLLVIHSPDDEVIPYRHGQTLFALATGPKQFLEIRGGHGDGWYVSRTTYRATMATFLKEALARKEAAR
jgi:uncharacterized protein